MKKMLTRKEACESLCISIPTLDRWIKKGRLEVYKTGESRTCKVLVLESSIKKFLKNHKK